MVLGFTFHLALGGRSVPVESEYLAEKMFSKIKPGIVSNGKSYSMC